MHCFQFLPYLTYYDEGSYVAQKDTGITNIPIKVGTHHTEQEEVAGVIKDQIFYLNYREINVNVTISENGVCVE